MHCELSGPQEYPPAWSAAREWISANQVELDMSRTCYEVYLNNIEDHPGKHHIAELCVSVA